MNDAETQRPEHSPWWPLKWMFLVLVGALAVAAMAHPERSHGEWAPLFPLTLSGPLLAIAARDIVLLLGRQEPKWQRRLRAASGVLALLSLLAITARTL